MIIESFTYWHILYSFQLPPVVLAGLLVVQWDVFSKDFAPRFAGAV